MIPNWTRSIMIESLADMLDGGYVEIREGSPPDPDDVATGTLLATIPLGTPAFGSATNGVVIADVSGAETTGITDGTAGWFRAYSAGDIPVYDGSDEMILSSPAITTGTSVRIVSWTLTMPDGS